MKERNQQNPICDCHMHLNSNAIITRMREKIPEEMLIGFELQEKTAENLIKQLDLAGIEKCFALSMAYGWGFEIMEMGDTELEMVMMENDYSNKQNLKYPDRLVPFFSINPLKDYSLQETKRCYENLHMVGLKLHFTASGVNLRDPEHFSKIKTVLSYAGIHGIPCLIHFRNQQPDFGQKDVKIFVREIVAKIPGLKIQMAHLGGWGGFDKVTAGVFDCFIHEIEKIDQIEKEQFLFDISGVIVDKPLGPIQPPSDEMLKLLVTQLRKYGIEYILFGSDYPLTNPKNYATLLQDKLALTKEEFAIIFSNNGKLLF